MKDTPPTSVLCWPKRLLSADDLRRHLTSQRELVLLPKTIVTPLAVDELRAKGVRIRWEQNANADTKQGNWFYAQEKPCGQIASAVQALQNENVTLVLLEGSPRKLVETLIGNYVGGVIFSSDPTTVVCIVNKIGGVRAAAVNNIKQVTRAKEKPQRESVRD